MNSATKSILIAFCALFSPSLATVLFAQTALPVNSRVVEVVDDSRLVTLAGNTNPLARAEFDRGPVPNATPMSRVLLVLRRSPAQESALKQLIDQQQDKTSSSYHQWMTPQAFGAAFGPSERDISTVVRWLQSHGFSKVRVNSGRTLIEFSGTAADIATAFHTEMHTYSIQGVDYTANASDPRIPAALAPVVAGVASLDNFAAMSVPAMPGQSGAGQRVPALLSRDSQTHVVTRVDAAATSADASNAQATPGYTGTSGSQTVYAVTPYDFAAIYDVQALWSAGTAIDGTGQTIAVAGASDINAADFVNFRSLFGLSLGSTGTPTGTQYLNIIYNGANPGFNGSEASADAQTQWAGAVAKGATIDYVASQATQTTQGIDLSAEYIIDNNLAPVMSYAGAVCEQTAGTTYSTFLSNLWQQAAAQGITVLVSAGDSGSAGCEPPKVAQEAASGLAVNAAASTAYDVAVGGTDFYMPSGGASYWSASNSGTQGSANGYIPEMAWNDSCANPAFASMQPYTGMTPDQVCNSADAKTNGLLTVLGGGGGMSRNGSKPSWQVGQGVPADAARDLPDVSLFAGDGAFSTFYAFCQQDANPNGGACTLGTATTRFSGDGGTAFSSAAMAGILALVNQKAALANPAAGARQGNANYVLYNLASKSGAVCSSTGATTSACIFHDVATGSNAMPCVSGSPDCTTSSGTYGVLNGWQSGAGYDLATGLGSLDVANLVNGWANATFTATKTTLALTPTTIQHGNAISATVNVTSGSGTPTGDVSINVVPGNGIAGANAGSGVLTSGSLTTTLSTFPGGTYGVEAHYAGDGTFAASDSVPESITVTPENSTTTLAVTDANKLVSASTYGDVISISATVAGVSGQGVATGNVSLTDNGQVLYGGVDRLNSDGTAVQTTTSLAPGSHSFVGSYGGDPSFNASTSAAASLTIAKGPTRAGLTSNTANVSAAGTVTFYAVIYTSGYGYQSPSGIVTLQSGGVTVGQATLMADPASNNYDTSRAVITVPAGQLPAGANNVTVTYPGDTNYFGSTGGPDVVTVTPTTATGSSVTVGVAPASVTAGGTVTFSATVTGSPAPTGQVQFTVDGRNWGAWQTLAGGTVSASISIAGLANGTHSAGVVYLGDANYKSSASSNTASFTINPVTGSTQSGVAISLNPASTVVRGTSETVTATVSPAAATGTVQLYLDGTANGSPVMLQSGTATLNLSTAALQLGTHSVTVLYEGDATYAQAYSSPKQFTVVSYGGTPVTVTLSGLPQTVMLGTPVQFTATLSPSTPQPTGKIQLIIDKGQPTPATALSVDPLPITLPTTGMAAGVHTVSVYYSGDSTYIFSTSAPGQFRIVPVPPTYSLTASTTVAVIAPTATVSNAIGLTVTPLNEFTGTVQFACVGLPTNMNVSCVFSPPATTITGPGAGTAQLTFVLGSGTKARLEGSPVRRPGSHRGWYETGGGVVFAGLLLWGVPRRRRGWAAMAALLVFVALGSVTGCGSGGREPMGPYSVVVTATSGALTQSTNVSLMIQ
ncbi:MAG: Ig-like domain repeat protein [Acidobacteriaceae bacterium]